jgi:S1-C subfamily serine protease
MDKYRLRDKAGIVVVGVAPDGAAADAGIQPGDVILEVNRNPVRNVREYREVMSKTGKGPLLFLIKRGRQTFYVSIRTS